ncbi:unnamed protein product [Brassica oleracea var. botrytis]|uniref:Sugar phosphate transporter domain-containing protein n=2 Tax=Brassica TaxID=3705 RepID=A0ABQ7ZUI6_BRANA|nr:hypothetical protein HID58_060020 [Brassica napus]VDD08623.1 unnamed protein product [Brassica oleracea]
MSSDAVVAQSAFNALRHGRYVHRSCLLHSHHQSAGAILQSSASQFLLGQSIPIPLWLSLAPVLLGVATASLTELSFNWLGFISAMISNISLTYLTIFSKKAMVLDSLLHAPYYNKMSTLTSSSSLSSSAFLLPSSDAITKVGVTKFISDLLWVGMFYHLYNQVIEPHTVAPLTHAVRNILKRVFVIGFAIVIFGNKILTQTDIGTAIAITGVALYSIIKAKIEEDKKVNSLFIVIFLKT